jgi:subtilisin family serine protease
MTSRHKDERTPVFLSWECRRVKQKILARALCLGIALSLTAGSALATGNGAAGPDPDRVWVKFKAGSKGIVENALRASGAQFHYTFDKLGAFSVSVPQSKLAALRNNPYIEYIEPDVPRYPMGQTTPYGIDLVQARDVWDANRDGVIDAGKPTGSGILVCVIDSGVHAAHEEFVGVNLNGGYPADWNTDTCSHGTHVAGTIAAANNGKGVVGVSPGKVSMQFVKVFDGASCGWTYSSSLIDAANRCQAAGAKVINMSLGGPSGSVTEKNAFASFYSQGMLSVAAAGNDGTSAYSYPASYDSVISVGALDSSKTSASFSQFNSQVELSAPGVSVLSSVPFVSATTSVAGQPYLVAALDGTYQGNASGAIANGGRCTAVNNAWLGKAVMCERGDITFADKVNYVASSGGAAAIVYNNVPGGFSGTLGGPGPAIPAVSMTQEDGQSIVASHLGATATVNTVPNNAGNGYAYYDGTSMASPHVTGVAALVWSANPNWTNVQIRQALDSTAQDLGTVGRDTSYGYGLVRAKAALDFLNGGSSGGGGVVAKVGSINLTVVKNLRRSHATANTTIVNQSGQALASANVTGCFSGPVSACSTKLSTSTGQANFSSPYYTASSTLTFCVTAVTGPISSFDSTNACRSN